MKEPWVFSQVAPFILSLENEPCAMKKCDHNIQRSIMSAPVYHFPSGLLVFSLHAPCSSPHIVIFMAVNHYIKNSNQVMACVLVHSLAVAIAACSSSFHRFATSGASGSSGLGAPSSAWIDSRIVRICSAGDQLPTQDRPNPLAKSRRRRLLETFVINILFSTSRQIRPSLSILG
jgi:hypothetical protein